MKVFLAYLLVCFYAGWLLHKFSMKIMTMLLIGFAIFIASGYFFLGWI